jgi:hypothetical protein
MEGFLQDIDVGVELLVWIVCVHFALQDASRLVFKGTYYFTLPRKVRTPFSFPVTRFQQ